YLLHHYNSLDHFFPQGVKSHIKNAVAGTKHIAKVKANVFIFEAFKLFTKFHKYAPHALNQRSPAEGKGKGRAGNISSEHKGFCSNTNH
ncbi:hypothetical protein, partial [Phocaeicola plebeius]|uniref:hypothetical protein n=1 Tax=Phocaeicola plebeius TaxID=310297 RepID=UPI003FF10191